VRAFCEQWLGEVERATPSVAIRLTDHAGHDVTEARVLVDGRLVTSRLDGRPFTVDPGVHVFRFEPAGAPAFEDRLVIVEAEKDRVVTEGVPSEPTPGPVGQSPSWIRGAPAVPVGVFVLGGVGLAGLAGFAYFAISGASDYDGCVQRACDPSTQSSLALRRALAWTSLGAGVIALGAGSWVFLSSRSAGEPRVAIEALPGGALAQVQAGF